MAKEGYDLDAQMNMVMNERFNVSGAMLVKLYGDPSARRSSSTTKQAESETSE